jgi:type I restriction enzyme S subunit
MTNIPYKLPDGWKWVKLSEVAWRDSVILRPSDNPKFLVRYLGMEHVSPGQWDEPTPVELLGEEVRSQVIMYRPGLVLYGRLRPYLNKVVVPSSEGVASTEFVPIAVNKDVLSPHYLGAYLRSPWFVTYATQNTTGSRQPRVRFDALWNAPVPLPPLEEQKRIVARIEELMTRIKEARKLRQESKEKTELLWQSALAETFPKPGTQLPDGWQWVKLGEVARIFAGSSAPQDKRYFKEGCIPFVRVQDLGRYGTTTNLTETVDKINQNAVKELKLVRARKGTILFPKSGAAILTNSRAILGTDAYIVSHLAAVETFSNILDTHWAFYWLSTVDMGNYIDNPAYPSLRLSRIKELLIPLPPLEEQKRIVAHLQALQEKIKSLKESQTHTETKLKELENSILDKAFKGEL